MDTLRFEIGKRDDPANGIVDAVSVFVNGRNLVDILREVELPFGAREGKPDLAGSYVGLPPEEVFLPSPARRADDVLRPRQRGRQDRHPRVHLW